MIKRIKEGRQTGNNKGGRVLSFSYLAESVTCKLSPAHDRERAHVNNILGSKVEVRQQSIRHETDCQGNRSPLFLALYRLYPDLNLSTFFRRCSKHCLTIQQMSA